MPRLDRAGVWRFATPRRAFAALAVIAVFLLAAAEWARHVPRVRRAAGSKIGQSRKDHVAAGVSRDGAASGEIDFEPCECTDAHISARDRDKLGCPNTLVSSANTKVRPITLAPSIAGQTSAHSAITSFASEPTLSPIPGLVARRNYVTVAEHDQIVRELEARPFKPYFGKSCQEYGFNFSFYITPATAVEMPPSVFALAKRMTQDGILRPMPNFVLVNRYEPGEGIHPHVDDSFYDGSIASVTLGEGAALNFQLDEYGPYFRSGVGKANFSARVSDKRGRCRSAYFEPRSFFAMDGEARYGWKHEMIRRGDDSVPFVFQPVSSLLPMQPGAPLRTVLQRKRRYCLTFRHVRDSVRDAKWHGGSVSSVAYG